MRQVAHPLEPTGTILTLVGQCTVWITNTPRSLYTVPLSAPAGDNLQVQDLSIFDVGPEVHECLAPKRCSNVVPVAATREVGFSATESSQVADESQESRNILIRRPDHLILNSQSRPATPNCHPYGCAFLALARIGSGAHLFPSPKLPNVVDAWLQHLAPPRIAALVFPLLTIDRAATHIRELQ